MRKIIWLGLAVAALALIVAIAGPFLGNAYLLNDAKREIRERLGLPKFWVTTFNTNVAAYEERTCPNDNPIIIVTGGQSNAANSYDRPPSAVPNDQSYMIFNGRCYGLKSPVLGTTGDGDSLWPALGNAIHRQSGRPVLFINGAVGGVQLGDWLDDRSGYLKRLSDQLRQARQKGYRPDYVLWIQGETDANTLIDPNLYVNQQKALIDRLDQTGLIDRATPWLLYRSTRCMHRRNNGPDIDAAMTRFTHGSPRFLTGPLVSAYDDSYRRDTCHLNRRGRDRLVADTMQVLGPRLSGLAVSNGR
ncbi:sialate O-acetylesterase [Sphingobium rhizovicinum]|uniref:Sialate O-acetylesterase n=1 Tax=Sphingobium rhizovicinum TaxID=432308 RepID=A0ABV7NDR5_9SPHN